MPQRSTRDLAIQWQIDHSRLEDLLWQYKQHMNMAFMPGNYRNRKDFLNESRKFLQEMQAQITAMLSSMPAPQGEQQEPRLQLVQSLEEKTEDNQGE